MVASLFIDYHAFFQGIAVFLMLPIGLGYFKHSYTYKISYICNYIQI